MNRWQGSLPGYLFIVALVAAGIWYADDPNVQPWPLSAFSSPGPLSRPLSQCSVNGIDWSADGRVLLSRSRGEFGAEAFLALHDTAQKTTGRSIDVMGIPVHSAALAPDGRHVLVGSTQGCLWWLAVESATLPTPLVELSTSVSFAATAIAKDGRQAAGATNTGSIYVCDLARRTCLTLTGSRKSCVTDLRFSHDGRRLVSADHEGVICVWELPTGELSQEFGAGAQTANAVEFLPDGKRMISGGFDDSVRIWELASGRELWRADSGLFGVSTLAVAADGMTAACGGFNRKIVLWDLANRRKRFDITTPAPVVFQLKFSGDGALLAAAGMEGTIRLYEVATGTEQPGIDLPQVVQDD